jgi:hypothetical protein
MNGVLIEAGTVGCSLAWRDKGGGEGRNRPHQWGPDDHGSIMRHRIVYALLWLPGDRPNPIKLPQQDNIAIRA